MERDARAYLWDVRQAADAIGRFIGDLDAAKFTQDALVRSAVERQFEIIGEALGRLARHSPKIAKRVPHLPEIVGFRNVLIHGYATVDPARVWRIARTQLPGLRDTVSALLAEFGPSVE